MADYAQYIWNYFKDKIGNEYGVAGLMGNLKHESGLIPYRVEGDFTSGYANSLSYTAKVDSGAITEWEFVNRGYDGSTVQKGYGLAQWTYYTRKQNLYNRYKSGGYDSIGSIELACDFLWWELQNSYVGVLNVLKNAESIRQASDKVLHDFENPADQSESVELLRYSSSFSFYQVYSGTGGSAEPPDEPDTPNKPITVPIKAKKLSLLMLILATKRR